MALIDLLACPDKQARLSSHKDGAICTECGRIWPRRGDALDFLTEPAGDLANPDAETMVREYRNPSPLFNRLRGIITSEYFPGKGWRAAKAKALAGDGHKLIVGSGVTRYENGIHLDIDDFPGVDLIADGAALPLQDESVTGVICEVVLEHVRDPNRVVSEAQRVLKPGGRIFFIAPFLFPFHGRPHDYGRWTREGLKLAFKDLDELEVGIHGGPCSAMVHIFSEWLYILTGLRYPKGYTFFKGGFTALLMPIKFLDKLVNRFPEAHRLAATLYVSGVKK